MSNELFQNLPDIIDAKMPAETLSISKSGAYALMNEKAFPKPCLGRQLWWHFYSAKCGIINFTIREVVAYVKKI